jgi:hypothetical protein
MICGDETEATYRLKPVCLDCYVGTPNEVLDVKISDQQEMDQLAEIPG